MTSKGITLRAIQGLKWNYIGTSVRIFAQFASQIILARILGPEAMGTFGFAVLVVSLGALVIEMGLGSALVQAPHLTDEDLAVACGRLLMVGLIGTVAVFLIADLLAVHVFHAPDSVNVIRAMAPALLISAASCSASAVLRRDLEFKLVQMSEVGSYIFGYLIVGVVAALSGLGIWSLVLAWLVQTSTSCTAMYMFGPRSLRPGNPFRKLSVSGFGGVVMMTNMLNWTIENGARVVIGRSLGATALGQFTVASNLVRTPAEHLVRNLQAVLFPMASRAQDNDVALRRAYLTVATGVGLVAFPVFSYVAAMADPIVNVLLGRTWSTAAEVLMPLSLAMIPHAANALCGPFLSGRGEPKVELQLQTVTLFVMLIVLWITASWSLAAVAAGLGLVYLFRWIWLNSALMHRLKITIPQLCEAYRGPCILAIIAGSVSLGFAHLLNYYFSNVSPLLLMVSSAMFVGLFSVVVTALFPSIVLGSQFRALLSQLLDGRPTLAQRLPVLRRMATP